jgi:hypothetical protein
MTELRADRIPVMLPTIQWIFRDRVLRRIFGLKRDEIIGGWGDW